MKIKTQQQHSNFFMTHIPISHFITILCRTKLTEMTDTRCEVKSFLPMCQSIVTQSIPKQLVSKTLENAIFLPNFRTLLDLLCYLSLHLRERIFPERCCGPSKPGYVGNTSPFLPRITWDWGFWPVQDLCTLVQHARLWVRRPVQEKPRRLAVVLCTKCL